MDVENGRLTGQSAPAGGGYTVRLDVSTALRRLRDDVSAPGDRSHVGVVVLCLQALAVFSQAPGLLGFARREAALERGSATVRRGTVRLSRVQHVGSPELDFLYPALLATLESCSDQDLDALDFGVIAFSPEGLVTRYNLAESRGAGFTRERVIGRHLFVDVAPCMNNFLVAQRFEDDAELDVELDYTFTFRVRPTPVRLRLLKSQRCKTRYVLVLREHKA